MHATICISTNIAQVLTIPSSTRQSVVLQGANYWQYESRSLQWPDDSAAAFRSRPGARFRTSKHSWDLSTIDSDIHTYIYIYIYIMYITMYIFTSPIPYDIFYMSHAFMYHPTWSLAAQVMLESGGSLRSKSVPEQRNVQKWAAFVLLFQRSGQAYCT